jgi:hypothetical protein
MRFVKPYSDFEIDRMVFSETPRGNHGERLNIPLVNNLIKCDPEDAPLQIPPRNTSAQTYRELVDMKNTIDLMGPEAQSKFMEKYNEDEVIIAHFVKIVEKAGYSVDPKLINDLLIESSEILLRFKYKHNRPRPWQLAPVLGIDMQTQHTYTAKSPSFPSGHATQSRLIAEVLAQLYPELKEKLIKKADKVAKSRFVGGLHYPSDLEYGKMLGQWMSRFVDLGIYESKTIGNKEVESNQEENATQQIDEEDERLNKIRRYKGKIADFKSYWDDRISTDN